MAGRDPKQQKEHDRVVAAVADEMRAVYREAAIFTNPDTSASDGIVYIGNDSLRAAAFPDVVVRKLGSGVVIAVAEIETAHSITEEEAWEWATFGALSQHQIIGSFYLYVPAGMEGRTQEICQQLGIRVDGLATYRIGWLGVRLDHVS